MGSFGLIKSLIGIESFIFELQYKTITKSYGITWEGIAFSIISGAALGWGHTALWEPNAPNKELTRRARGGGLFRSLLVGPCGSASVLAIEHVR